MSFNESLSALLDNCVANDRHMSVRTLRSSHTWSRICGMSSLCVQVKFHSFLGTALDKLLGRPPRLTKFPCVFVPNMLPRNVRFLVCVFSKAPSHSLPIHFVDGSYLAASIEWKQSRACSKQMESTIACSDLWNRYLSRTRH